MASRTVWRFEKPLLNQHSTESLAALLRVSPRTLRRLLKEEGVTLQGLKDEVRCTRALELMHRTPQPHKQVAEAAGSRRVVRV